MKPPYEAMYDPTTGDCWGVARADAASVPADANNSDWRAFLTWNSRQQKPLDLWRKVKEQTGE